MKHDDVWHVLPFFVNGTVRGRAHEDVETHLATCAECRAELATQTQIRDTIAHEEVRQDTTQSSFEQLWDRILEDEAVVTGHAGKVAVANAPAITRASASPALKWLVAAVIVEGIGLAALSAVTWSQSLAEAPDFRTLSSAATPVSVGQIRAVFSPDLRLGDLQTLLSSSKLSVVGGPTEAGVYTLTLDDSGSSVDSALAHLRGNSSVRFAEPIGKARAVER
jgi:hypothetical protein